MENLIYFDNNATTPVDPRVLEAMMPFFLTEFGNASSTHQFGMQVSEVVKRSRQSVADLIGATRDEIIFTSGATQSINQALKGYALLNQKNGNHIVTLMTEHKAVLDTCKYLESIGFDVEYLPVKKDGIVDLNSFEKSLRPTTLMACVMMVNNETGVFQPMKEISSITQQMGILLFSDMTQAVGKMTVNVKELGIDIAAFSGHKFYGPKGIGGLYINGLKRKSIKVAPLLHGGGHENGDRSGTLNVTGIVGMAKASEIAIQEIPVDATRVRELRNRLEGNLLRLPGTTVNGSIEKRMYNVTNICFPGMDANVIVEKLKDIAVSNGSACTAAIFEPSHVLKALGLPDDKSLSSIRFSLGKFNTFDEVESVSKVFEKEYNQFLKYA